MRRGVCFFYDSNFTGSDVTVTVLRSACDRDRCCFASKVALNRTIFSCRIERLERLNDTVIRSEKNIYLFVFERALLSAYGTCLLRILNVAQDRRLTLTRKIGN